MSEGEFEADLDGLTGCGTGLMTTVSAFDPLCGQRPILL
jgi:hypothetical protein